MNEVKLAPYTIRENFMPAAHQHTQEIYINVIDDYAATPTQGIVLADGLFKVLPSAN